MVDKSALKAKKEKEPVEDTPKKFTLETSEDVTEPEAEKEEVESKVETKAAEEEPEVVQSEASEKENEPAEPETAEAQAGDENPQETSDEVTEKEPEQEKVNTISSFSMLDSNKNSASTGASILDPQPKTEEKADETAEKSEDPKEKGEDGSEQISSDEVKKWLKDVRPDTTKEVEKGNGSGKKTFVLLFVVLVVLGAAAGGLFYFKDSIMNTFNEKAYNQQPVAGEESTGLEVIQPETTPVPTEEVDFSQYSVSVLNGSGVAGEAGKMKSSLEELEFKQISTGNASSQDYTATTISVKEGVPEAVFESIRELIKEDYAVVMSEDRLNEDSAFDVIMIIGLKKN
jgi:hypothetical protein